MRWTAPRSSWFMTTTSLAHRCRWIGAVHRITSGGSGWVSGTTALPPRADLQAATSALRPISSASLQGADLLADRAVRRFFLRVVGRLPWLCDCREFVRQASDKPQGRKPRAVWSGLCRLSGLWRFNRTICSPDLTAARIDGPSSPRFSRRRSSTRSSPTPISKTRASA